jgi:hypothetical protein
MFAIATFLIVAVFSMVLVQFLTGALIATGLPPEIAGFQARSAFSGAGFTTTESENVVNHESRRKIISIAMLVGSLGTPTLVVTVVIGLIAPGPGSTTERTLVTIAGIMLIFLVLGARPMKNLMQRVGNNYARSRLITALSTDPEELLSLGNGFIIASVRLAQEPGDTYRSLAGLRESMPGVHVLGVQRGSSFFGEQPLDITLHEDDELVVYATRDTLTETRKDLN